MISTVYMHRMRELTSLLPPYLSSTPGNVKSYNPDFSIITAFLLDQEASGKCLENFPLKNLLILVQIRRVSKKHLDYHITDITFL